MKKSHGAGLRIELLLRTKGDTMEKRYFEFRDGASNKFWEIRFEGSQIHVRYGKIGAEGQSTIKDASTPDKANAILDKLIGEKLRKGYKEKKSGSAPDKGPERPDT